MPSSESSNYLGISTSFPEERGSPELALCTLGSLNADHNNQLLIALDLDARCNELGGMTVNGWSVHPHTYFGLESPLPTGLPIADLRTDL